MLFYLEETTTAASSGGGGLGGMLPTILMLVAFVAIFYFMIIRPQKKQDKQIAEMRNSISVGDEIITIGGIVGTVLIIKDDKIMIETGNDKSKLTILRNSVKTVLRDEEDAQTSAK